MYNLKLQKLWLSLGLLLVVLVIFLSLAPFGSDSVVSKHDKLNHAIAYGVLMFWFCGVFIPRYYLRVGAFLLTLGLVLELLQGWVGRMFDYRDLTANLVGIFIALIICRFLVTGWCLRFEKRFFP